jgi:hypothetical protein
MCISRLQCTKNYLKCPSMCVPFFPRSRQSTQAVSMLCNSGNRSTAVGTRRWARVMSELFNANDRKT